MAFYKPRNILWNYIRELAIIGMKLLVFASAVVALYLFLYALVTFLNFAYYFYNWNVIIANFIYNHLGITVFVGIAFSSAFCCGCRAAKEDCRC